MQTSNKKNKFQHKKGDIFVEPDTKIKKGYDGSKWRRLCSVDKCERIAQRKGFCMRHFGSNYVQQQSFQKTVSSNESPIHLPIGDFFMIIHDRNNTINDINDRIKQKDIYHQNLNNDSIRQSIESVGMSNSVPENLFLSQDYIKSTEQIENSRTSSTTVIPTGDHNTSLSSDVIIKADTKQTSMADIGKCKYSVSLENTCQCNNSINYKCSHCPSSFCHQQDLKDEIHCLLSEAQKLFNSVDKLNMNSGKKSCTILLDQWASTMHAKIDQKREELQMKLDQLDRQIEENKNQWKIFLKNQLEMKVGCVLTELSQTSKIDGLKFNKARLDFISSQKLFHLFDHQQLLSISNIEEKEINFNLPRLHFSNIASDDFNWMEIFSSASSHERIKWFNYQEIYINGKFSDTINSNSEVNDNITRGNKTTELKNQNVGFIYEKTSIVPDVLLPITTTSYGIASDTVIDMHDYLVDDLLELDFFTSTSLNQKHVHRYYEPDEP